MSNSSLSPLVVLALSLTASLSAADQISGVVRELASQSPIADAIVTLQATGYRTTTRADGSYTLEIPGGIEQVVVGAREGYFNGSVVVDSPAAGADIFLELVPQDSDPNYEFVDASGCSFCHFDQVLQWEDSPMALAGTNTWVLDIYSGLGTPGGQGGFVYTRDSVHAVSNPDSECASCHQPELWVANGFSGALDPGIFDPSSAVAHGVSCDMCHKIASVDESKINFPGIYPGSVTLTQPSGPSPNQVQYGVLGDVDYVNELAMRASYQPQLLAEVCAACHQDKNDPDGNGNFEEPNGVISEPTYLEWLNSPYGDEESPLYATCVDCHMPPVGSDTVCTVLFPPLLRDPQTIRSHAILGTTPEFLENAVEMEMQVSQAGTQISVDVDITNSLTGHRVPTGVTIRNMILLVEAWIDGDDPLEDPLISLGTQTVHDLGGIGDPAQGYYAGLPGKYFAKLNHDASGQGPTFFTDATGIQFDTRIEPLATDSTSYSFLAPGQGETVRVRARLIYRRSFRFLTDAKGWTEDGHGEPLADVLAPDYGHLMEVAEDTVAVSGHWANLGAAKSGTHGVPVLQGVGPFTPDSYNSLVLSNARGRSPVFTVIGLSALNAPLKGGVLVPATDFILPRYADESGGLTLTFPWRAGLPSGLDLYYQMWISDDKATHGFAASNGLRSTSQS